MKKFLKLGRLFPLFTLLTACPEDFAPANETETKASEEKVEEEKTTTKETETSKEEKTTEKEEDKVEETKEEEKEEPKEEPEYIPEEEKPYQPDLTIFEYVTPIDSGFEVNENTPTTETTSSTTEESPVITSTGFKEFHEKGLDIHKTNRKNFTEKQQNYYLSAKSTISGTLLLEEGYVTRNVTSYWYYLGASDVFKLYDQSNKAYHTTDPDKSFYPDVFRSVNIPHTSDMRQLEQYYHEENERVKRVNDAISVNKYMYFYLNTRAANLNEIIDSPYYSSLTGGKNYKFEYSIDANGLYATRTTDKGKTSYSFDNRGRMTKVVIKSNTVGQEDFTVNVTYSTETIK